MEDLKTNSITILVSVKNSSIAATRGGRTIWHSWKPPLQWAVTTWPTWILLESSIPRVCIYLTWLRNCFVQDYTQGICWKPLVTTLQLHVVALPAGLNKSLPKKTLKGKTGEWDIHKVFEKFQYSPGNPEGHVHVQECADAREKPKKDLLSHLWPTLRQYTSRN